MLSAIITTMFLKVHKECSYNPFYSKTQLFDAKKYISFREKLLNLRPSSLT